MSRPRAYAQTALFTYQDTDGISHTIPIDSPAWYAWLSDINQCSFTFTHALGTLTVRKERKQRGSWYWSAYRQVNRKLYKYYLGKSDHVSMARLQIAAQVLARRSQQQKIRDTYNVQDLSHSPTACTSHYARIPGGMWERVTE